jgi:DNA repair protein RadC
LLSRTSCEHEVFSCLYLDNRHRVIACEDLFRETIDGASVHPHEVVKAALGHNHPSGIPDPSKADELITVRLKEALAIVDIRILDHMIVAGASVYSFAEHGLL